MPTATKKSGFSVKTFSGLSKKRMASKGNSNFGKRIRLDSGMPMPVQFLQDPDDFLEYDTHSFKEDGRWTYVPCLGEDCPLCQDEDRDRSKVTYRFLANVYNLKDKKVQILEGPKDMATRIFYRYSRKPSTFLKRTFEVTKLDTQPVSYDVSIADEPSVKTTGLTLEDLQKYLNDEAARYYGDTPPSTTALDADDEDDDDVAEDAEFDDDELREELAGLTIGKLTARAKKSGASAKQLKSAGKDEDELIDLIVLLETPEDDDDDDEDEFDEDALTEELEELSPAKLKARAKANGGKLKDYKDLEEEELIEFIIEQERPSDDGDDDEDDDDDLDEDDDDLDDDAEDDEDDPPAKKKATKKVAKKAPPRKKK